MSAFLGPIHDKMFARITFLETIERYIYNEGMLKFGDAINKIRVDGEELYGGATLGYSIEEVVDTSNIHGSLQELVNNVEKRHSFILNKILEAFEEEGKELLYNVYKKIGSLLSNKFSDALETNNADAIYEFLSNYYLDGMPCNSISGILENNDNELSWIFANDLHKDNFINDNVDFFYDLRANLTNEFLNQIGSKLKYTYDTTIIKENEIYVQKIMKMTS